MVTEEVQYIPPTRAEQAEHEWRKQGRRMTLVGGVRLDYLKALATTDEEPFLLTRRKR
jgi:hypothetical protein